MALSTPVGRGAIAIVRLSGEKSEELLLSVFRPFNGQKLTPRMLTLGELTADNIKDKVMAVVFKAPLSYTGEDMAEIHCHGSPAIVEKIILALIKNGAKLAEGGEFTKRAFLNGKLSLDEAEAVGELINARTTAQINAAYAALRGGVNEAVTEIYKSCVNVISAYEAAIDYPEEDVEEQTQDEALAVLNEAQRKLAALISTYDRGEKVRGGVKVAIVGVPNAGKSSLLNRLLGRNRAIVTDIAGTTRDTIEESYEYKGMLFTIIDTAGIRVATDEAEKQGVERSADAAKTAHIVLNVTDLSCPVKIKTDTNAKIIEVYNKADLVGNKSPQTEGSVIISALTGEGVDELKEKIYQLSFSADASGTMLTAARHYALAEEALKYLNEAVACVGNVSIDCALVPLRTAASLLASITGANASEDVISEIFSRFCVGK